MSMHISNSLVLITSNDLGTIYMIYCPKNDPSSKDVEKEIKKIKEETGDELPIKECKFVNSLFDNLSGVNDINIIPKESIKNWVVIMKKITDIKVDNSTIMFVASWC